MHSNVTIKNVSWPHFSWATLYAGVSVLTWKVPWLSFLAVVALTFTTVIFLVVPLRYIVLIWGLVKFTAKLRHPDAVHHVGLFDFLARVPSNRQLVYEHCLLLAC